METVSISVQFETANGVQWNENWMACGFPTAYSLKYNFSSGQLHEAASSDTQTVHFMEQPPAIDTELLEWSASWSSLKRLTVSRAVSSTEQLPATLEQSTEQPPAIHTELLEWSAPWSSLKRQTVSRVVSSTEQPPVTLEWSTTWSSIQWQIAWDQQHLDNRGNGYLTGSLESSAFDKNFFTPTWGWNVRCHIYEYRLPHSKVLHECVTTSCIY